MSIYEAESLDIVFKQVAKLHHSKVHTLLSGNEVFPGQPPLLRALAEQNGQSQRELADKLQIAPATLTVMIGRMEKTGLVERQQDIVDQRVSRVFLTPKGEAAHREMREVMLKMDQICYERFTTEERIIMRRLLLQMYENLKKSEL